MSALEVVFDVPHYIETGLMSGSLQRIGGVIINRQSKQVVAWLRDGAFSDDPVTNASSVLAKAMSGARGIQSFNPVALQTSNIITLMATGQIINLALTGVTLYSITHRLDRVSQEIEKLGELIRGEFRRDRHIDFKSALEAARDVFESGNESRSSDTAIQGLYKAREHFLADFNQSLSDGKDENHLMLAQQYLLHALYAETSRIRCYLVTGNPQSARKRLSEGISMLLKPTQRLVESWLGQYPAVFFHKDVPSVDLNRFLQIQRWLVGDDASTSSDDAEILFQIIDKFRVNFWNPDVENEIVINSNPVSDLWGRVTSQPKLTLEDRQIILRGRLDKAESVIENYERLQGFELELRSMRLSFDEWQNLVDETVLKEKGIGLIIDSDILSENQMQ